MQSPNTSKNTQPIKIGLFFNSLDNDSLKDVRYKELMSLMSEEKNLTQYLYALYTDTNLLAQNIFLPVFHTIYLGCSSNNIVLQSLDDSWLTSMYPHNKYYYLVTDKSIPVLNNKIHKITSIREII